MAEQTGNNYRVRIKGDHRSDLRPTGASVVIGGQEYNILFTIGAIEAIQETCNKALVETMPAIANVANYRTDADDLRTFYNVVAAFLTVDSGKKVTADDIDGIMKPTEMQKIAITLMEAYGFSMPDPDSDDEDSEDEEEENPNQETGL